MAAISAFGKYGRSRKKSDLSNRILANLAIDAELLSGCTEDIDWNAVDVQFVPEWLDQLKQGAFTIIEIATRLRELQQQDFARDRLIAS